MGCGAQPRLEKMTNFRSFRPQNALIFPVRAPEVRRSPRSGAPIFSAPRGAAPYGDASQRLGGPKTSICLSDFEVMQRI